MPSAERMLSLIPSERWMALGQINTNLVVGLEKRRPES
jgi:hypothetical protein